MDKYLKIAQNCFWNTLPRNQGQIVTYKYPQERGKFDEFCPELKGLSLSHDSSTGNTLVAYNNYRVLVKNFTGSVADAIILVRERKKKKEEEAKTRASFSKREGGR